MTIEQIPQIITWPVAAVIIGFLVAPVLWALILTIDKNAKAAFSGLTQLSDASSALKQLPEQIGLLREASEELKSLSQKIAAIQIATSTIEKRTATIAEDSLKSRLELDWAAFFDQLSLQAPDISVDRRTVSGLTRALLERGRLSTQLAAEIDDLFTEIKSIRRTYKDYPDNANQRAKEALSQIDTLSAKISL